MDSIDLPQTRKTPRVNFAADTRILTIQGESFPENSFQFYEPILAWVERCLTQLNPGAAVMTVQVDMPYMNSSSTKCMLDLLDHFEDAHRRGIAVRLCWCCDPNDARALELAEEFKEEFTLPFDLVTNFE